MVAVVVAAGILVVVAVVDVALVVVLITQGKHDGTKHGASRDAKASHEISSD